ncbi:MAG: Ig-like domain-containing protein, partial [Gallicola sp.]|nr:Ig-like domain-containing protein [Gallicola sp.]
MAMMPMTAFAAPATKIEFSTPGELTKIGETATIEVTYTPTDPDDKGLIWQSSNENVAKVSSAGIVTAIGNGTAIITAELLSERTIKATTTVTVNIPETYALTVTNGTGGGEYEEGAEVEITATVPEGKAFKSWTVTTGSMTAPTTNPATIKMPAEATTLTADFEDVVPETYALTVTGGTDVTGTSPYEEGAVVSIKANEPEEGKVFDKWTTADGGTFEDATKAETS